MTSSDKQPQVAKEYISSNPRSSLTQAVTQYFTPELASYFVAGGVAGAASRTIVSPLERIKIIQQIQSGAKGGQYHGVWRSLVRIWNEEGFKGFMRGNGINCLRIVPYSAVQFSTYETLKKIFSSNGAVPLDTPTRLLAGALAGITSVSTTYPLDLVRARLSIVSASLYVSEQASSKAPGIAPTLASTYHTSAVKATAAPHGIVSMTLKIMREEGGVRALYRGLVPTALGVAPYVGLNFSCYELLRGIITPPGKETAPRKLTCGALAGSFSQTLTYPFDVLRRKMQVTAMGDGALGYKYNGAIDAVFTILRTEGIRGLYHGLWPNLLKVAPSIATSFYTYELVKKWLGTT
ncbi:mitochondrial carrier [Sistotremastrum suecicum HHB10207 ss-3]|uniref:Mitochondrial carrier n=1 Tax=Sistotremastrum suecicum HHB10207 ss-3 TaxID=1314776 RepID=A0A166IDM3_9AGAM|nr:mitochondrial carrier [Sistotremastrum suecicum HHB10207 ss-3]